MQKKGERGQVTIFIIVAMVIVAVGILVSLLYPKFYTGFNFEAENPEGFLQNCLEDEMANAVTLLSSQGGSLNPAHYFTHNKDKLEYLCYTNKYYTPCMIQQPALATHIESEILRAIEDKKNECIKSLEDAYKKKGYKVSFKSGEFNIELLPKRIVATINDELTLTKKETKKYESFNIILNNNLYELTSIANSILNWEAKLGDSDTTRYMTYYRDLKVEKKKQSDGTTVYILTDRNDKKSFKFATRSLALPPGYIKI